MSQGSEFKDDGPDRIGPETGKKGVGGRARKLFKAFTTKDGLIGNYDVRNLMGRTLLAIGGIANPSPIALVCLFVYAQHPVH
jgi:hypothetical protein